MDSRIDPLRMLGLAPGDAKILRNAGARVTEDVLVTLVRASYLLGVDRVMVVPHTDCRMTVEAEDRVSLVHDVQRVRSFPYLNNLRVAGFLYYLDSGRLEQID